MAAQKQILNERYQLGPQQGSGGMAVVYKALDLALGRAVAIKILRPALTGDPAFLARFRQEARNVANLQHPNIVTLHDVGQDGGTYYMVMEFVDGQDLKKLIRNSAPFSVERALHIAIQMCAGLGFAHRAGLVHADVKPQNVLVTDGDTVKITDFGIAQALSHTQPLTRQTVVWGSPQYFSPEQATGVPPTAASDVYSIGVVMFEMLTGRLPYTGADQQELALAHIREAVPHITDFNKNVPANVDWVVHKVMSKEPAARYRQAEQLGRILISYQKQLQDGGNRPGASPLAQPAIPSSPSAGMPSGIPTNAAPLPPANPVQGTGSGNAVNNNPYGIPPSGNTPPPGPPITSVPQGPYVAPPVQQPPVVPVARPGSAGTGPLRAANVGGSTPSEPMRPVTGPYRPQTPPGYVSPDLGSTSARMPNYQVGTPVQARRFDLVTLILGLVAFVAVVGLILLWLVVWGAYT